MEEAERRGELRAEEARAEDPDRHVQAGAGHRLDALPGLGRREVAHQLHHVLREPVGVGREIAAERAGGELIGARRAAEPEVDAPRVERLERAELLGDHERRVVRQHDPAGADPDGRGGAGDVREHHRRGGARHTGQVVVLRDPEAPIAPALGVLREIDRVLQRLGGRAAFDDRREIEDRERDHRVGVGPAAPDGNPGRFSAPLEAGARGPLPSTPAAGNGGWDRVRLRWTLRKSGRGPATLPGHLGREGRDRGCRTRSRAP